MNKQATAPVRSASGGKRVGSGRKRSESKKIRISTSLSADVLDYLNSRTDKPKAQIIEDAVRSFYGVTEIYGIPPINQHTTNYYRKIRND